MYTLISLHLLYEYVRTHVYMYGATLAAAALAASFAAALAALNPSKTLIRSGAARAGDGGRVQLPVAGRRLPGARGGEALTGVYIYIYIYRHIHCSCIYVSIGLSIYLFIYLSIHPSIHYRTTYLSIHPSIHRVNPNPSSATISRKARTRRARRQSAHRYIYVCIYTVYVFASG